MSSKERLIVLSEITRDLTSDKTLRMIVGAGSFQSSSRIPNEEFLARKP